MFLGPHHFPLLVLVASRHGPPVLSVEDLFLAGIGCDIAGAYLVSRGVLQDIRQLAISGGTIWALERPRAPYAADDRCRGAVGLLLLGLGFVLQAAGYAGVLAGSTVHRGRWQTIVGVGIACAVVVGVLGAERLIRPRWRTRILVRVARYDPNSGELRDLPLAHLLRSYGEELGSPKLEDEDDIAYCARVFQTAAEANR